MRLNKYDQFLIDEFLVDLKEAIKKEDRILRQRIIKSDHEKFYRSDFKGIMSNAITERTLQYIVFRDLLPKYKIIIEDLAYKERGKRLDLSIYKNIEDWEHKHAEIGIELKLVKFKKNGQFFSSSIDSFISDFDKLKKSKNLHNYLLQIGEFNGELEKQKELLYNQIYDEIDGRIFRKFVPILIDIKKFKSFKYEKSTNVFILCWKVVIKV